MSAGISHAVDENAVAWLVIGREAEHMPVKRKRVTPLGEVLRKARQQLGFDQDALGARVYVSKRTLARWESGEMAPTPEQSRRLLGAVSKAPSEVVTSLAALLGVELEEDVPDEAPVVAAPSPPVAHVAAPAPVPQPAPAPPPLPPLPQWSPADVRVALDAVVLAAADEHDVVPRKLRSFGAALLRRVGELGIPAKDAAAHVAIKEPRGASD